MSIFTNRTIKVSANKRNKFNLSSKVITTLNIGDTQPIFAREVIPSDKWFIDVSSFTRLSPVAVPTYAQIKQVNRAFFVKYKDIWRNWEAFYTNTGALVNGTKVAVDSAPSVTNAQLCTAFVTVKVNVANYRGDYAVSVPLVEQQTLEDNSVLQHDGNFYSLTLFGKRILNILNGLGIKLNWSSNDTTPINILPILAYLKVYLDYYLPSRYFSDSTIRNLLTLQNVNYSDYITDIFQELINASFYYIDNDYFTSSWSTPNNIGSNALVGTSVISDISSANANSTASDLTLLKTPALGSSTNYSKVTAQGLQILESLYNWITRKNLSGNKYFEQILTQYGIHIPYHDDMRSLYLGGSTSMTDFGVVFDTGSTVGSFAGNGINKAKSGKLKFESDDYGVVIVLTSLVPEMGYVQGRNREWLHTNRLDFFQPEFDCIGMQGVRKDELLTCFMSDDYKTVTVSGTSYSNLASTIIGYQPRYNEYRRNIDLLNGDFIHDCSKESLQAYHSFRIMPSSQPQQSTLNQYFRRSDSFSADLNRIFQNQNENYDHFIAVFDVNAIALRKMKSNSQAFELDGYDEVKVNSDSNLN